MTAPAVVKELVERFESHRESYHNGQYNETQLRQEYLNPLFEALGWDVYNRKGYADAYKEVIHEDAIKIGGRTKAPDYCFRAGGGQRSFFVEAKKPAVDISEAISPAYQLRRYAWSAKLPVSILTDFEEFAVYDCRIRPDKNDKASTARVIYLQYSEYIERWDELLGLFSPEAIRKGSLDKFVTSKRVKKGTAEVDKSFLDEIEGWRNELARHLALRNEISQRDLNFAVQKIIDRIIFLRICEDRGIEPYGTLESLQNAPSIYLRMRELFQRADDRYNSGLFHFTPEKDRSEPPDELTLDLTVEDKPLKQILGGLYFPESPYEFSVFPAEILGQVYEQFLGKVIRLTKGHQAKVEEKPEVRKAGGVYYTPSYIVDYIVRNTVGKLLGDTDEEQGIKGVGRGKMTPTQAAKLRILDPACGSGSFLLGAYQYLLDWHRDWYVDDGAEKHAKGRNPKLYRGQAGDWRLTSAERKRILLNNIYGVDIDEQAVEVTKLSLLLKVLEGESAETIENQKRLFHERALPDLGDNIKCGNSLIGRDFYNGNQLNLFDDNEQLRINAFDWNDNKLGFGKIMSSGGFDAVIGNPPYVRSQLLESYARRYFDKAYRAATRTYDIYVLFVEQAFRLVKNNANIGFIIPNKFFTTDYGEGLRIILGQTNAIRRLVDFQDAQIFPRAGTYTTLFFGSPSHDGYIEYASLGHVYSKSGNLGLEEVLDKDNIVFSKLSIPKDGSRWTLATGKEGKVLLRVQDKWPKLEFLKPHIFQGLKTSADKVYLLNIEKEKGPFCLARNRLGEEIKIESQILKPVVKGEHVQRYSIDKSSDLYIIYPYRSDNNGEYELISSKVIEKEYPLAWSYLKSKQKFLECRDKGFWAKRTDWYAYARCQNIVAFLGSKILLPYMTTRLRASIDKHDDLFFVNITTGGYGLRANLGSHDYNYLLGLLNSNLLDHIIKQLTNRFRGGYYAINKQGLERLPFRPINFSIKDEKRRHDRMVELVETMLELNKKIAQMKAGHEKTVVERQIAGTDRQIDQLVYELYGLTDEEIAIVEQS